MRRNRGLSPGVTRLPAVAIVRLETGEASELQKAIYLAVSPTRTSAEAQQRPRYRNGSPETGFEEIAPALSPSVYWRFRRGSPKFGPCDGGLGSTFSLG